MAKEKSYRSILKKADGSMVGLDFYAENGALAYDHAYIVAVGASLEVVKVRGLGSEEPFDAGSFYSMDALVEHLD